MVLIAFSNGKSFDRFFFLKIYLFIKRYIFILMSRHQEVLFDTMAVVIDSFISFLSTKVWIFFKSWLILFVNLYYG